MINPLMQHATMKDVASLTGYHPSTVSLALRGDRRITEHTRELIAKAAQHLGYRKNPLVSAWVSSRRTGKRVGPHISLAFLVSGNRDRDKLDLMVFRAAQREAVKVDYHLTLFDLESYDRNPRRLDQILQARGVQGVIVGSSIAWRQLRHLSIESYAWVAIGRNRSMLPVNRIDEDHMATMSLYLDYCEQAGHRKVGLVLNKAKQGERQVFLNAAYLCSSSNSGSLMADAPVLNLNWDGDAAALIELWAKANGVDVVLSDGPQPHEFSAAEWISLLPDDGIPPQRFSNMDGVGKCALRIMVGLVEQNRRGFPDDYQTILVGPCATEMDGAGRQPVSAFDHGASSPMCAAELLAS